MSTALFLGRFQPPHIGHILTIRRLSQNHSKVIVGVTESEPSIMPILTVINLMIQLLPEDKFEIRHIKGSVEGGTAIIDCDFDVCCSGNPAVLSRMSNQGYKTKFIERSIDRLYSGTQERNSYIQAAVRKSSSKQDKPLTEFKIIEIKLLRPIEKINPTHLAGIERDIWESRVINKPIIVDRLSMAVLDGSHRYAILLKHGFKFAPVLLCDYDDESIFVGNHLGHRFAFDENKWINKQHVRAIAISGNLYEPRTTRHFFPFRKRDYPTSLSDLDQTESNPIEHLLAKVSKEEEIIKNQEYIEELNSELAILKKYIEEQTDVLNWLKKQNEFILRQ